MCVCVFVVVAKRLVWCDRDNRSGAASRGPAGGPQRAVPGTAPATKKLPSEELDNKARGTLEEYFFSRDKAELTPSAKVGLMRLL